MSDAGSSGSGPDRPGVRLEWKWGALLAVVVAALIVALAIDGAGSRAARDRYAIAGDGDAVWRLDKRTGDLARCAASSPAFADLDDVECVRIDTRGVR